MSTKTTHKNNIFTPASYLLQFFDSNEAAAQIFVSKKTGKALTRSAISKWTRPKKYQGTDGQIPAKHWPLIISKGWMTIEQLNSKSFEAAPLSHT